MLKFLDLLPETHLLFYLTLLEDFGIYCLPVLLTNFFDWFIIRITQV